MPTDREKQNLSPPSPRESGLGQFSCILRPYFERVRLDLITSCTSETLMSVFNRHHISYETPGGNQKSGLACVGVSLVNEMERKDNLYPVVPNT